MPSSHFFQIIQLYSQQGTSCFQADNFVVKIPVCAHTAAAIIPFWKCKNGEEDSIECGWSFSDLGKKIYGLEPWPAGTAD